MGEHWPTLGQDRARAAGHGHHRARTRTRSTSRCSASDWLAFVREAQKRGLFQKIFVVGILLGEPEYIDPLGSRGAGGHAGHRLSLVRHQTPGPPGLGGQATRSAADKHADAGLAHRLRRPTSPIAEAITQGRAAPIPTSSVAAFKGLKVETPIGPITFRAVRRAVHHGRVGGHDQDRSSRAASGIMVNHEYIPGEKVLPSDDEVKKLRPGQLTELTPRLSHRWEGWGRAARMSLLLVQLLSGLANAMFLFLVASGLSLIFGVTRIVNFAHGSFYMLAAYLTYSLAAALPLGRRASTRPRRGRAPSSPRSAGSVEVVLLPARVPRARALPAPPDLRPRPGRAPTPCASSGARTTRRAPPRRGSPAPCAIAGQLFPELRPRGDRLRSAAWRSGSGSLFHRTRWGILIRAATQDREMVAALGVDQSRLFTGVFVLGSLPRRARRRAPGARGSR